MRKEDLIRNYESDAARYDVMSKSLKKTGNLLVAVEIIAVLLSVALIIAFCSNSLGHWALFTAVALIVFYLIVRHIDVLNDAKYEKYKSLQQVLENELSYHRGDFSAFSDGNEFSDPQHPFTFDLDIFGHQSLYNRINRTITTGGSEYLSQALADTDVRRSSDISKRQAALSELAKEYDLKNRFIALGSKGMIDTEKIEEAVKSARATKVPSFPLSPLLLPIAFAAIAGFIISIILASFGFISSNVPIYWGIIQFAAVLFVCSKSIHIISEIIGKILPQLKSYISLIEIIASSNLKEEENAEIIASLTSGGSNALQSFKELKGILDGLDRRGNVLGLMLFNTLFLSDFFLVRNFLKWRGTYMEQIDTWIHSVSHFDALVSMATFMYNEPQAIMPEIKDDNVAKENGEPLRRIDNEDGCAIDKSIDVGIFYEAKGLYHPFLGEKAVTNDFEIRDGHYYIITGANMAGKSTFLRAIGINYVLAMCGMPVFASSFKASLFSLFSSMRTTDDLTKGISYFNAELLRLQQLMDYCCQNNHTLIILDEILKGTNSLDKLNGSRLFLQTVSKLPVSGIIATHDLELSKMEDEDPKHFTNFCFEIELTDNVKYSYKISRGVAKNQNATFLLKKILK